jgi:hypothetical protein
MFIPVDNKTHLTRVLKRVGAMVTGFFNGKQTRSEAFFAHEVESYWGYNRVSMTHICGCRGGGCLF